MSIYIYLITVYFQIFLQSYPSQIISYSWVLRLITSTKWKEITAFTQELANLEPHFILPEDTTLLLVSNWRETNCSLICSLAKSLKGPQGTCWQIKKSLSLPYRYIPWNLKLNRFFKQSSQCMMKIKALDRNLVTSVLYCIISIIFIIRPGFVNISTYHNASSR